MLFNARAENSLQVNGSPATAKEPEKHAELPCFSTTVSWPHGDDVMDRAQSASSDSADDATSSAASDLTQGDVRQ